MNHTASLWLARAFTYGRFREINIGRSINHAHHHAIAENIHAKNETKLEMIMYNGVISVIIYFISDDYQFQKLLKHFNPKNKWHEIVY